jgi:hypothetical protein
MIRRHRSRPFLTVRGLIVGFAITLLALAVGFFAALVLQGNHP